MNINDLYEAYAEMNNTTPQQAREWFEKGLTTEYELFEAYLNYEGIIGYTNKIITAFRICWNLNNINKK